MSCCLTSEAQSQCEAERSLAAFGGTAAVARDRYRHEVTEVGDDAIHDAHVRNVGVRVVEARRVSHVVAFGAELGSIRGSTKATSTPARDGIEIERGLESSVVLL
jgi:hypothetical protein